MNEQQNRFAAATVYYTLKHDYDTITPTILILDLDHLTAGLCTCTNRGVILQIKACETKEKQNLPEKLAESVSIESDSVEKYLDENAEEIKKQDKRFLRSQIHITPLNPGNADSKITCGEVDHRLSAFYEGLEKLLGNTDTMLQEDKVDLASMTIVLAGIGALFFPIEARVREHFTGNPLVADPRFASERVHLAPTKLVETGEKLYEQGLVEDPMVFEHNVAVRVYTVKEDGTKTETQIDLAKRNTPIDQMLNDGSEWITIFFGLSSLLRLLIDGEEKTISLPFDLPALVSVRPLIAEDQTFFLQVRYANDSESLIRIPIDC